MSEYVKYINNILKPSSVQQFKALDLFSGCGGLSLGFEAAGFETLGIEMDVNAVNTYNLNLTGSSVADTLHVGYQYPNNNYDIIIGGPPCQPFSVGGYQRGKKDTRDGFPIFIDAVKQFSPSVWMFENVRGMMYSNKGYLIQILRALEDLGYYIAYDLVNSVTFEVPQKRERLIVIGSKKPIAFPKPIAKKMTVNDAIGDLIEKVKDEKKILTRSMDEYVLKYEKASKCINPRDLYPNRPARTVTCRNISGATGDMMRVKLKDGRRRRISVREAARLQSFPDWFQFTGNETQQFNQVGNAVPPMLAYHFAKHLHLHLENIKKDPIDEKYENHFFDR